jgi:hypothetical protein
VKWGSEDEERKGPSGPGMFSESRHAAWRDYVAPGHVARLTRHLSSHQHAPNRRGGPRALARPKGLPFATLVGGGLFLIN